MKKRIHGGQGPNQGIRISTLASAVAIANSTLIQV
jgi:hypothetical protein